MKKRMIWIVAALLAVALSAGCTAAGEDTRHEIYRVYEGQNDDWMLEVRLWVEHDGSILLPADLTSNDSNTYTRTYWEIAYHGDKNEEELSIVKLEVVGESWSESTETGDSSGYLDFDYENGWKSSNSPSGGIQVDNAEACYAVLTDAGGNTLRIDAPLAKTKG